MSNTEIEKRLAALEAEVALLKSKIVEKKKQSKNLGKKIILEHLLMI